MTTTAQKGLLDAIVWEPLQLALDQPPQLLISAASVFLVSAEAAILIDSPWNIALAVGAEWAYLRGLCSGQAARTKWQGGLIWAAVILVIAYGSLWGLRKFHLIPDAPPWYVAVLLTTVHIGCISAVTLCAAMCHRAAQIAERETTDRAAEQEAERQKRIQDERDRIALEAERKRLDLVLWEEGQAAKMRTQDARTKMRRDARPARAHADAKSCPKCGRELEQAKWLAARRWGHCEACKE